MDLSITSFETLSTFWLAKSTQWTSYSVILIRSSERSSKVYHFQGSKQPIWPKCYRWFSRGSRSVERKWAQAVSPLTTSSTTFWTTLCWTIMEVSSISVSQFSTSKRAPSKWYKSWAFKSAWKTFQCAPSLNISKATRLLKLTKSGYSKCFWTFCLTQSNSLPEMGTFLFKLRDCPTITYRLVWQTRVRVFQKVKRIASLSY